MQSSAKTVNEYLQSLPSDRKAAISKVRQAILKKLPQGYKEVMDGMIVYIVPLETYPKGYLDKKDVPLPFAAIASQKNHMAVYLMNVYGSKQIESWFRKTYKATGKKLNMGKSCIRFKKLENLPVELIGEAVAKTSVKDFIQQYEAGAYKKTPRK